jgi:hypothetical protein
MPMKAFGAEHIRMLPSLPSIPPLASAPQDRLLVSWWDREVAFCQLDRELLKDISTKQSLNLANETDVMQRILVQVSQNNIL